MSDHFNHKLFEALPIGLAICDMEGNLSYVNPTYARMLGYTVAETLGLTYWEITPKDYEQHEQKQLSSLETTGTYGPYEKEYIHKDGHRFPVRLSGVLITEKNEKLIWSSVEDISEQFLSQQALKTSEANLAEAQRIAGLGSWKFNGRTGEASWSDERFRIFGYEPGEIEPSFDNFKKSVHPDDRDRVVSEIMNALKSGKICNTECRISLPNGTEKIIHLIGETINDDVQNDIFMSGTVMDITERKQSEETLRKMSRALEQSPNAVFITDLHGSIEYVNPKFTELTGYTSEESLGQNPRILKSNETPRELYNDLWKTIRRGDEWKSEIKDRRKNGSHFWAFETITPVKDENGIVTHYVATHEDISERKDAELAIHTALEHADIANRAKSELLANMSHELRTPLNAIIGFSGAIKEETLGPIGNEKYREYNEDIANSGQHLLELINDILDVSAIEAGMLELDEEDLQISNVIEASIRLVMHRADQGKVNLTSSIDDSMPMLRADERRVKQILINLLSNAIKFTRPDGKVSLNVTLDEEHGHVFTLSDTGVGMDKKELAKAMQQFGQVDRGSKAKHEGTGLGLPLTKGLIDLHGGTLKINSKKGVGTTATVVFHKERVVQNIR